MSKDSIIYARVSEELKKRVADEAALRSESDAVIVREALREYFSRRDTAPYVVNDKPVTIVTDGQTRKIASTHSAAVIGGAAREVPGGAFQALTKPLSDPPTTTYRKPRGTAKPKKEKP